MDGFQTIQSIQGAITVKADEFSNYGISSTYINRIFFTLYSAALA
jgi:hypothetical protein